MPGDETDRSLGRGGTSPPATDPSAPLLAIYSDDAVLPEVIALPSPADARSGEELAARVGEEVRRLGGRVPDEAVREVIDNLVHAGFHAVTITVAQAGNTVRVADRGPGISDKEKALRSGFTTAGPEQRRFIRGVGAGLGVAAAALDRLGGSLLLEDNLDGGTVVTLMVPPPDPPEDEHEPPPAEQLLLSERQLQTLLLVVELGPAGPTRLATELGIAPSTAYREVVFLEEAGLVATETAGRRTVTEAGMAYLEGLL
jgi:hypothetical protein